MDLQANRLVEFRVEIRLSARGATIRSSSPTGFERRRPHATRPVVGGVGVAAALAE
jgi:hypothetical protein